MDPDLQLLLEGAPDDEVDVIVRLHRSGAVPPQLRVVAPFGEILTGRLRRGAIEAVRRDERVASMKAPTPITAGECPACSADAEFAPSPGSDVRRPDDRVTGAGTVIAAVDWGLAVDHPDFR